LQLLMFMVEKRGQLVTREQISSELWSKDVFVDVEQGINTAIRKIRRALADDADEPNTLKTVVGRGYRFVAPNARGIAGTSSRRGIDGFRRRTGTCHHDGGGH
jgi:DNA-binding winged helix-turn-helix (wHTH) protein